MTNNQNEISEAEYLAGRAKQYDTLVLSGTELDALEFPPQQWTIPGILPSGYALLAGPPKAGKSFLVAEIGLNAACGGYALGGIKVEPRPVLYFALEDGDRRLQKRFREILNGQPIPENMKRITTPVSLRQFIELAHEEQDRAQAQGLNPPLIIADTLARVAGGRQPGADAYQAEYAIGAQFQRLAERLDGTSVLAVHHTNKGEHTDFINAVSGTLGTTAATDVIMLLSRSRKSENAVLAITGRDIEHESEIALHRQGARWQLTGGSLEAAETAALDVKREQAEAAVEAKYGNSSQLILDEFKTVPPGQGLTPRDIAEATGLDSKTAGTYLRRLEKSGHLKRKSRGVYTRVESVESVESPAKAA